MKADFKEYSETPAFVAANLRTRIYWAYKRNLIPQSYPGKLVKEWHKYYVDILRFGLNKEGIKLLNSPDFYLDIDDGEGVPAGIGPEPVRKKKKLGWRRKALSRRMLRRKGTLRGKTRVTFRKARIVPETTIVPKTRTGIRQMKV